MIGTGAMGLALLERLKLADANAGAETLERM
jgi:hypothetical protein